MTVPDRNELERVIELIAGEASKYFAGLDDRPVRMPGAERAAQSFRSPLPEVGEGAVSALQELIDRGIEASIASSGPRCFHFVIGGSTPAAFGADMLTSVLDPMAYAWIGSPLAIELERISLDWLRDLFGLQELAGGILTSGATMANFVGLMAARQWWGERHSVDVAESGLSGLPPVPVFTSGYVHASAVKALAMMGVGRGAVRRFERDAFGRVDLAALRTALEALAGAPVILIGNAGEVNAGDFDPLNELADLAEEFNAWLHVDGAFGLFARTTPRVEHLCAGVERAHSVAADGHKWLNVPYDCGFAFVQDPALLARAFVYDAAYLPDPEDERPVMGAIGPESSRRARSLTVWATLRAYGRTGVREMVEGHLDLAQHLSHLIDAAPDLERMAETQLCIVCFRYTRPGENEDQLDALNARLGEAILEDGRYYVGTSRYGGRTVLRPAIVNWRTREQDLDGFIRVVRELGARIEDAGADV